MECGNLKQKGVSRVFHSLVGGCGRSAHLGEWLMVVKNVMLNLRAGGGQFPGPGATL